MMSRGDYLIILDQSKKVCYDEKMISRAFYLFIFFLLLPICYLLIFKPKFWPSLYSKLYLDKVEPKGGLPKLLLKSFLALVSGEFAEIIHQAIGIFLAVIEAYIFFRKLLVSSP